MNANIDEPAPTAGPSDLRDELIQLRDRLGKGGGIVSIFSDSGNQFHAARCTFLYDSAQKMYAHAGEARDGGDEFMAEYITSFGDIYTSLYFTHC